MIMMATKAGEVKLVTGNINGDNNGDNNGDDNGDDNGGNNGGNNGDNNGDIQCHTLVFIPVNTKYLIIFAK